MEVNPDVERYLIEKYGPDYRKKAAQDHQEQTERSNMASVASSFGNALAGRSNAASDAYYSQQKKDSKDNTIGRIEADRKSYIDNAIQGSQLDKTQLEAAKSDPKSQASISFRKSIESMNPGFVKAYGDQWENVSAADQEMVFKPLQLKQQMEDRALARADRMTLAKEKDAEKQRKDAELSATQAKQLGLHQLGDLAERQYQEATSNPKDFDPTVVGQVIDNSSWAPAWAMNENASKARTAQSNWVEAFLRDASGAAIPPSERLAYAQDYFPQPGETPAEIENKARLRKQKMQNALIGSGPQGAQIASTQSAPESSQRDPQVESYAQAHGISYEQALRVKQQRTSKQAGM